MKRLLLILLLILPAIAVVGQVSGVYSTTDVTETSADTYTASVTPLTITTYTNKRFLVQFPDDNDGPATLNIDGLGAKAIINPNGDALEDDDILANRIYFLVYDGTSLQMIGGRMDVEWGDIEGTLSNQTFSGKLSITPNVDDAPLGLGSRISSPSNLVGGDIWHDATIPALRTYINGGISTIVRNSFQSTGAIPFFVGSSGGVLLSTSQLTWDNVYLNARLKLPAGDNSTPGMILPSGSLLGTKVPGAIESDGDHVYWTDDDSTRYQLDQQASGIGLSGTFAATGDITVNFGGTHNLQWGSFGNAINSYGVFAGEMDLRTSSFGRLQFNSSGITLTNPTGAGGLKYSTDPITGGNYSELTVVPKKYVDSIIDTLAGVLVELSELDFTEMTGPDTQDLTMFVSGAHVGNGVTIGLPPTAAAAGTIYTAWVSDEDEVTVRMTIVDTSTVNPDPAIFYVYVIR